MVLSNVKFDNFGFGFGIKIVPPNTCTVVLPAYYMREDNSPNARGYEYELVEGVFECTNTSKTFTMNYFGYANIYYQDIAVVPLN